MDYQHKDLAAGGWKKLSFVEQMANIGSEVERALNWKNKNNAHYSSMAFERALELLDLTIENEKRRNHLRELLRLREALADYFASKNVYGSTPKNWDSYFHASSFAARIKH